MGLSSAALSRYLIDTRRLRYVLKSLSARSQLPRRFPIQNAWRSPVTTIRHVRNVTPACPPPSSCGMRFLRRVCCLRKRKVGHQSSAKISALPGDLGSFFSLLPSVRRPLWCTSRPYLSLCVLLYVARMCVCSSRAAAVAPVMADAKIEHRRKIEAGGKGGQEAALANLQAVGMHQSFRNARIINFATMLIFLQIVTTFLFN